MFKLAFKNIFAKPFRAIAIILVIAVTIAMAFTMLSFKDSVYSYIYETETAAAGSSTIKISTTSSSDRIINPNSVSSLNNLESIEKVTASLSLYALYGDEYVGLRGFESGHVLDLQNINVVDGSLDSLLNSNPSLDNIVISKAAADHFNLAVDSRIELSLGTKKVYLIVCAVAEQNGYFLDDSPFQFIGINKGMSGLLGASGLNICNEVYVRTSEGVDVEKVIKEIKSYDAFDEFLIEESKDTDYISEQTDSLTAPVVLAGAAVLVLAVVILCVLFLMTASEKTDYISRLQIIGANKKQIVAVFLIESVIYAFIGAVIGALLGIGVFAGIIKSSLSASATLNISALYLFAASIIGAIVSVISSLLPIVKSFRRTIQENIVNVERNSKIPLIVLICLVVLCIVSIVLEFVVTSVTKYISILSIVLLFVVLAIGAPIVLRFIASITKKSSVPELKVGSNNIVKQKRFTQSVSLLTIGMTVAMMLFMAWSLTTSIFTSYINNFNDMAFIYNIQSTTSIEDIKGVDGVDNATKMVWKQGEIETASFTKTMNILGSKDVLDMVDFEYITDESIVRDLIETGGNYIFVDVALKELYSVNVGDTLTLIIDGKSSNLVVGGILKHELFSGNYLIMNSDVIENNYGIKADTILVTSKDIDETVKNLRLAYSGKNYYVIKTLDAYKWDMESMEAIFDLVGTLAFVVTIFIFVIAASTAVIGRSTEDKLRSAYLNAGMSKNALLKSEIYENTTVAILSYALSFAFSVILTAALIHALRLFGLYFNFMYKAWVVALVGAIMTILYSIMPVALNYKKGYNIKKIKA